MRIIHVTETLVAGVLAAVAALASKQAELGHRVAVMYPAKPAVPDYTELQRRFHPAVEHHRLPFFGRLSAARDLRRAMVAQTRDGDVDVVHLHSTFAGLAGRTSPRIRRNTRVIVYSPHGWAFLREGGSPLSNRSALGIERALSARCDGLVLVSESEAAVTREQIGDRGIHVVANGVPVDSLPVAAPDDDGLTVIASGRVIGQKAPDRFADVARALSARARFVWVGDGTPEDRARWFGDAPVEVTGWMPQEQVVERLSRADVFLFPSRWEGMPISLMEAQVMGLPAVATDIGGNRDVVLDGETGCLAPPEHLTDAVGRLLDDAALRDRMRESTIRIQRERLSDAHVGERSLEVYGDLAARGVARRPHRGGRRRR